MVVHLQPYLLLVAFEMALYVFEQGFLKRFCLHNEDKMSDESHYKVMKVCVLHKRSVK